MARAESHTRIWYEPSSASGSRKWLHQARTSGRRICSLRKLHRKVYCLALGSFEKLPVFLGLWPLPSFLKPAAHLQICLWLWPLLLPPSVTLKDLCDYIGPIQITRTISLLSDHLINIVSSLCILNSPLTRNSMFTASVDSNRNMLGRWGGVGGRLLPYLPQSPNWTIFCNLKVIQFYTICLRFLHSSESFQLSPFSWI